ncbi:DUF969 domain-containing protein [Ilyobacter polytropus]|uniref:Permease n=1 Tax=Ilyobacter polytropus (strain ATCC 51220 / DSM 2926 / LMG 16218 / CuHBu1) TaxID=572544 RepID=E3H785_ILYPC|nr:DUF969 domain-containing protein [Ilyobacter polytropus]ADO82566.1 protein of unknown function DUF969 [Ilyobacter polytropus DSM 2926]
MIKLIGILIIVLGFTFRLDTIAVVLVAGVTTCLVSGVDFMTILSTLGEAFVKTRYMTLFLLTLPVIGILERNGLKERGAHFIKGMNSLTSGRILSFYMLIRTLAAALSVRLGGHVQFIRPLIHPMAQSASENKLSRNLSEKENDKLKGVACAVENYGNFFGQNVFVASGGVLLIVGTLQELGIIVEPYSVSKAAIPMAFISVILSFVQNYWTDMTLSKAHVDTQLEKEVKE